MSSSILSYTPDLRNYLWENGIREHTALKELRLETAKLHQSIMQIGFGFVSHFNISIIFKKGIRITQRL